MKNKIFINPINICFTSNRSDIINLVYYNDYSYKIECESLYNNKLIKII